MLLVVENLPSLGYPVAMREKITLQSHDLDGYLTAKDEAALAEIGKLYDVYLDECRKYDPCTGDGQALTRLSAEISGQLERIVAAEDRIHVYSFETPRQQHSEGSRLIARLRDPKTGHEEFLYYIQRAYELLFTHVFADQAIDSKRSIIQTTPVTDPAPNYAVHRIPDIDPLIHDCVMCVMLRGALLPSMIVSKEIQDYSSDGYITPFALFRIIPIGKNVPVARRHRGNVHNVARVNGCGFVGAFAACRVKRQSVRDIFPIHPKAHISRHF